MSDFNIKLTGSKNLDRLLDALPDQMSKRVLRGSLLKSAKPIPRAAKRKVPVRTGDLKKSLAAVKAGRKEERKGEIKVLIGARRGKRFRGFHAHLVEFGTAKTKAQPFLGPALIQNRQRQRKILVREIALRTHKEASKLAAKFRTRR